MPALPGPALADYLKACDPTADESLHPGERFLIRKAQAQQRRRRRREEPRPLVDLSADFPPMGPDRANQTESGTMAPDFNSEVPF